MIFVTGATGFIGHELVSQLLAGPEPEPVRALGRDEQALMQLARLGADPVRASLEDERSLRRAALGCRLVYHVAGLVSHERRSQTRLLEANGEGVRRVLEVSDSDARVVIVSCATTFGPATGPEHPVDESRRPPSRLTDDPHAASKAVGERYALDAVEAGRDVVIANPGFVIGPGDLRRREVRSLRLYRRGLSRLLVPGGRSHVDVRDVARGLQAVAERGRTGERYLLVSRAGNLSQREFFALAGELAGRQRRQIVLPSGVVAPLAFVVGRRSRSAELRDAAHWWFYDQGKAERELGYRVRPLRETLASMLAEIDG
ncbi:MAG: NAD-dependent epimerase/dehydratase family protein [Gaiellaceae bacterium]